THGLRRIPRALRRRRPALEFLKSELKTSVEGTNMKFATIGAAAALLATAVGSADAQLALHPYVEFGIGVAEEEAASGDDSGNGVSESRHATRSFSVGLADLIGPLDLRVDVYNGNVESDYGPGSRYEDIDVSVYTLNLMYAQPLNKPFEVYGGVGAGVAE